MEINYWGTGKSQFKAMSLINELPLTGNEKIDRLLIQKCVDEEDIKCTIVYNGKRIWSANEILRELRILNAQKSLNGLSKRVVSFVRGFDPQKKMYDVEDVKFSCDNSFEKFKRLYLERIFTDENIDEVFSDVRYIASYF